LAPAAASGTAGTTRCHWRDSRRSASKPVRLVYGRSAWGGESCEVSRTQTQFARSLFPRKSDVDFPAQKRGDRPTPSQALAP